jgi:hypothetical protein
MYVCHPEFLVQKSVVLISAEVNKQKYASFLSLGSVLAF